MIEYLFIKLLNMSLTASLVISIVLLARIGLRKMPKIFSYVLWGVVLFRLLCPISFSSAFSFLGTLKIPSVDQGRITYISEDITYKEQPKVNISNTMGNDDVNRVREQNKKASKVDQLKAMIIIASWIWLIGLLVMLGYSVATFVMLKKKLRSAWRERDNIYIADNVITPLVIGILRPKIYLPYDLNEEKRRYILLHEQIHVKRGDHVIRIVSFLALCLHWFNPLVWIAFFLSGNDMEMSCDEAVIRRIGNGVKKEYSLSLLTLASGKKSVNGIPLAFGEGDTSSRIKNVLNYKKPALKFVCVAVIVSLIITVVLVANPKMKGASEVDSITEKEEAQTYYGIIMEDEGTNRMLISIPRLGEVVIPATTEIYPYFELGDEEFALEFGDLVKIRFALGEEIQLQESDPGVFSNKAESIVVIARGLSLYYEGDNEYLLSFPLGVLPDDDSNVEPGDKIEIYTQQEGTVESFLIEAEVVNVSQEENRVSIRIPLDEIETVLSEYGFGIRFQVHSIEEEKSNIVHIEDDKEYRVIVRSVSRSLKGIDRYFFDEKYEDLDNDDATLVFAENCVYKVNYEMTAVDYKEVSFDTFAKLIEECDPSMNKPCVFTFHDNLIVEACLESGYVNNGIGFSQKSAFDDWYDHIKEIEGEDVLEKNYTLAIKESFDISDSEGEETVEVYTGDIGDGENGVFLVNDAKGNLIYTESAHTARAGWNTIYLGSIDGTNFIMTLHIEDRDTYGGYNYQVFRLSDKGKIQQIVGSHFEFGAPIQYDDKLFREWAEKLDYYLEKFSLILSSQDGEIRTDRVSDFNKYNYETLRRTGISNNN